ncbi:MAG: CapA family protein [Bellilinea sp.]
MKPVLILILLAVLAGCAPPVEAGLPIAAATPSPTLSATPFQPEPEPLTSPAPPALWLDPALPDGLRQAVVVPQGWQFAERQEEAAARLTPGIGAGGAPAGYWVYALAARFATVEDEMDSARLRLMWSGRAQNAAPLLLAADTLSAFSAWWGAPGASAVQLVEPADLVDALWQQPDALAILPFEQLEPRLKVLALDGISPLARGLQPARYPLALPYYLSGSLPKSLAAGIPAGNRDEAQLTVVALTGVTALVRASASTLRVRGIEHALSEVADWLRAADITHINNEVAFRPRCAPALEGLNDEGVIVFPCSDIRYIELLEAVGTDVVEMTGDHFIDAAPQDVLFTIDEYHRRGWQTYGGGRTLEEGWQPALFDHNGNRIAFLGCNAKGRAYAAASPTKPGAVLCDFERLAAEVSRLRGQGYLPIVTFSHLEYETFTAREPAISDFQRVAEAGALIVSGSQGHLPQAMAFHAGGFLHFGLGNLFFDQFSLGEPFDRAFIDRHVFYQGRYIATELLTLRFENFVRSRAMTAEERAALLEVIFAASGW